MEVASNSYLQKEKMQHKSEPRPQSRNEEFLVWSFGCSSEFQWIESRGKVLAGLLPTCWMAYSIVVGRFVFSNIWPGPGLGPSPGWGPVRVGAHMGP